MNTFFGILIINPSYHSSGIFSSFHIFSTRAYSISTVISGSALSTSRFILSRPTAFPFFNYVKANFISVFVGGFKFTSVSFSFLLLFSFTVLISCLLPVLLSSLLNISEKNVLPISSVVVLV